MSLPTWVPGFVVCVVSELCRKLVMFLFIDEELELGYFELTRKSEDCAQSFLETGRVEMNRLLLL